MNRASARRPDDLAGRTLGRYRIEERLGAGGMGEVYRAFDTTLERPVAVKRLRGAIPSGAAARDEALREARAAAALEHPAIVAIYDFFEAEDEVLIVQELASGRPLAQFAGMPLDLARFLAIAEQCAEVLAATMARGIVHCDIKPGNIMYTEDGRVRLLDFGVARMWAGDTGQTTRFQDPGAPGGTLAYLAPELLQGSQPAPASDMFSLGVVFYELLAGRHPFLGPTLAATVTRILQEEPPPPSQWNAAVPDELDAVVCALLAKDPAKRWTDPVALASVLAALRAGPEETAPAPAAVPRLAVGRFESQPDEPSLDSFAVGLTEALRVRIASREGIEVFDAAHGSGGDLRLEGSVQRAGKRLRIRYRITDPRRGITVGGGMVEGTRGQLFDLEDRVISGALEALERAWALRADSSPRVRPTGDVTAYDAYLQARGYLQRFYRDEDLDLAVGLLQTALERDPGFALASAALGRAYWRRYQATHDTRWAHEAEKTSHAALGTPADLPEIHATLGMAYLETGRAELAAHSFRRAGELDPRHEEAWIGLAQVEERAGRLPEAEGHLRRALELHPESWAAANEFGKFLYRRGRLEEARSMFQRVVELTPDNALGYTNLGGAHTRLGQAAEAIVAYERSLALRPNAGAYANLATLYRSEGRYREAVVAYERAIQLRPQDHRIWGSLAGTYRLIQGCEGEARRAQERAAELTEQQLEINPNDPELMALLAQYIEGLRSPDEVRTLAERAIAHAPGDPQVLFHVACALDGIGDREEAAAVARRAVAAGCPVAQFDSEPQLSGLLGKTPPVKEEGR